MKYGLTHVAGQKLTDAQLEFYGMDLNESILMSLQNHISYIVIYEVFYECCTFLCFPSYVL